MKYLTQEDARSLGVILEVNRQLLHARGLALEVSVPNEGEAVTMLVFHPAQADAFVSLLEWLRDNIEEKSESPETGAQWRTWVEQVQAVFSEARTEQRVVLTIQDHRDDPEGVYYDDLDADDAKKVAAFLGILKARAEARVEALGYLVQPPPEIAPE